MAGIEETAPTPIRATHRVGPVLLLAVSVIVVSVFAEPTALYAGLSMLLLVVAMRGYALLATLAASRTRTVYSIRGRVDGTPIEVVISVANPSFIPIVFAELSLEYSPYLRLVKGARAGVALIPPRGVLEYRAVFTGRVGRHRVGPLKAVVRDPLGLFRSDEIVIARAIEIRVVPRAEEVTVRKLWVETRSTGITRAREAGTGVEFYGIREYRPGDEIRRIVWRHLALAGRLTVKEMERESYQSILFIVDATPQMFMGPYGATPFEHAARVVTSIAGYLARRGDLMALVTFRNSGDVYPSGPLSRGRAAYLRIVKVFAETPFSLEGDTIPTEVVMRRVLRTALELLPRERNLVFVFTSIRSRVYLDTLANFVNRLRALGNEVYVAVPITMAYEVKGLPGWAQAIYRVRMFEQMREELKHAKELRRYGVRVLALGPQLLPETIVRIIETSRVR